MWKPGIAGKYFNSAVICMFMENWAERKTMDAAGSGTVFHHFRHRLLERTEELLGTESEFTEVVYLGAGIFAVFLIFPETAGHRLCREID